MHAVTITNYIFLSLLQFRTLKSQDDYSIKQKDLRLLQLEGIVPPNSFLTAASGLLPASVETSYDTAALFCSFIPSHQTPQLTIPTTTLFIPKMLEEDLRSTSPT